MKAGIKEWLVLIGLVLLLFIILGTQGQAWQKKHYKKVLANSYNSQLAILKAYIKLYKEDKGAYPYTIDSLKTYTDNSNTTRGIEGSCIPANPYTPRIVSKDEKYEDDPVISHHWKYNQKTGEVTSAVAQEISWEEFRQGIKR